MTPLESAPAIFRRVIIGIAAVMLVAGCNPFKIKPQKPVARYQALPAKQVPPFMNGSVFEWADLLDAEPLVVSGYGLVVNLDNSGDNTQVPTAVREYIFKEMVKRGFGSKLTPGFERTSPEEVLRDPRTAIVRVDGAIPPGARSGDTIDVRVSVLPTSTTSSLARGELYRTDLKIGGADQRAPGVSLTNMVLAEGPLFVNPAYLLQSRHDDPAARRSLRTGWVLDGGRVMEPRALVLRLRQPERRLSRAVEGRIDNRFASLKDHQRDRVATAQDEGIVKVVIPPRFRGDWEHFAQLMTHLYFDASPDFVVAKAKELAELAVTPDAPLQDISFCWEGLGPAALPFITPLMTHQQPDVSYAAARAAAYLGDPSAPQVLAEIAATQDHAFRLNAVRALGFLPPSPLVSGLIQKLLASDDTLVRIEAYNLLAAQRDPSIYSRVVNERFVLDIVPAGGRPMVYASRTGLPRIALIGPRPSVDQPSNFTAFDDKLTMVFNNGDRGVKIFYRFGDGRDPIRVTSNADLAEIIARLGGDEAARGQFDFSYCDIVGLLQGMGEQQQIVAREGGKRVAAQFVLQPTATLEQVIGEAPPITDQSRPAGDGAGNDAQTNAADGEPAPVEQSRPN